MRPSAVHRSALPAIALALAAVATAAGTARAATCDSTGVQAKLTSYASLAASMVDATDKAMVSSAVSGYAEGSTAPEVTQDSSGDYQVSIPSRAAAYYLAGVDATFQGNKLVAGWAFMEAARRNPTEPMFLNNAAFILLQYGFYADARDLLRCALAEEPTFNSARVNLGYALGSLGDHAGAAGVYLDAALDNPTNDDYQYLAATELARAGATELAEVIAEIGRGLDTDHDFGTLIASLPSSTAETCSIPVMPPPSSTAFDFVYSDHPTAHVSNVSNPVASYKLNTLSPAINQASADKATCESTESQDLSDCRDSCNGDSLCTARCECAFEPRIAACAVTREQTEYQAWVGYYGYWNSKLNAWYPASHAMLAAIKGSLSTADYNWARCEETSWNQIYTEGYYSDAASDLPWEQQDITLEQSNVAATIGFYCSGSIETWLYTGGASVGLEPQWCIAFICFSYDAVTGNVSVSASLLLSAKLSVNALTGDWGVDLGVGAQLGVGQLALGGGIYFKFTEGKSGIEAKANIGPLKVKYFAGFETLSVPVAH